MSNTEQKPAEKNHAQFLSRVITAYQDTDRNYKVGVADGVTMPLEAYLSAVTSCRGTWKSLGIAYNPSETGPQCMEMAIYFMVPAESPWNNIIAGYVQKMLGANISVPIDEEGQDGSP